MYFLCVCRISQVRGQETGSKFYEGNHTVIFKATDTDGATAYCVHNITVKGYIYNCYIIYFSSK